MTIVIAAVALVAALCLLDLLLTFGVIRRLREHTALLAGVRDPGPIGLEAGQSPGAFSAVTTAGDLVDNTTGLRVVAFFSTSCSACPERVPPFAEYLRSHSIGRDSVLAVVSGTTGAVPPYLDQLTEVAQVCIESADGDVARAFRVLGFPLFCVLDPDGVLIASGYEPSVLSEPAHV